MCLRLGKMPAKGNQTQNAFLAGVSKNKCLNATVGAPGGMGDCKHSKKQLEITPPSKANFP